MAKKATESEIRALFEEEANRESRIYNLHRAAEDSPAAAEGHTYWSLHTERAWKLFLAAWKMAESRYA